MVPFKSGELSEDYFQVNVNRQPARKVELFLKENENNAKDVHTYDFEGGEAEPS